MTLLDIADSGVYGVERRPGSGHRYPHTAWVVVGALLNRS
jgi:hypothetical protein